MCCPRCVYVCACVCVCVCVCVRVFVCVYGLALVLKCMPFFLMHSSAYVSRCPSRVFKNKCPFDFIFFPLMQSPAARAGLMSGDVLVEFDGNPVIESGQVRERERARALVMCTHAHERVYMCVCARVNVPPYKKHKSSHSFSLAPRLAISPLPHTHTSHTRPPSTSFALTLPLSCPRTHLQVHNLLGDDVGRQISLKVVRIQVCVCVCLPSCVCVCVSVCPTSIVLFFSIFFFPFFLFR